MSGMSNIHVNMTSNLDASSYVHLHHLYLTGPTTTGILETDILALSAVLCPALAHNMPLGVKLRFLKVTQNHSVAGP